MSDRPFYFIQHNNVFLNDFTQLLFATNLMFLRGIDRDDLLRLLSRESGHFFIDG